MAVSAPRSLLVIVLLAITYFLVHNVSGVVRTPIKQSLSFFPTSLDEWRVISHRKSTEQVIKLLGVDDYINYNYVNEEGQHVNFYAGFYEAVGNGIGYHSPKNCIPGGGWGIERTNTIEVVPVGSETPVRIAEMVIRNGNEYQVVFFWYQNRGRIIHSEYWEKIYLVLDSIFKKRRDGTFVRLMSYAVGGDIEAARDRLVRFAGNAITELGSFLPGKKI